MFPVSIISSEPVWVSLPCAKIVNYPLEKEDYKPYAQARICISDSTLFLQMISFEVNPESESRVMADLSFDGGKNILTISSNREGEVLCLANDKEISKTVAVRVYTGEDEQGIYWAVNFSISLSGLKKYIDVPEIKEGKTMAGNFYKISNGKRKHFGCWMDTVFSEDGSIKNHSLSELEFVKD